MSDEEPSTEEAAPEPAEVEAPVDAAAPVDAGEKPKKKKKKAKADAEAAASDPRAREIAAAFEAGNFARVRELGAALIASGDGTLIAVGHDYLARIAVDPVQIAFLGLCAVALLTIAWIYVPH